MDINEAMNNRFWTLLVCSFHKLHLVPVCIFFFFFSLADVSMLFGCLS